MVRIHRSRALGLTLAVVLLVMAAGCLTLTTQESTGAGGSAGNSTSSSSGSSGEPCMSVQDCPIITLCKTMACMNGTCVGGFVDSRLPCDNNNVCDGKGSCVECVVDNDCPLDNADCVDNKCVSCADGIQNGNETGVDCGNAKCGPCPSKCANANECMSGFCVDGVCCDSLCTDTCKSCNVPGKAGKCASLPSGAEDPGTCDTTQACGDLGQCLLKNGQPCTHDGDCLSGNCASTNACEP